MVMALSRSARRWTGCRWTWPSWRRSSPSAFEVRGVDVLQARARGRAESASGCDVVRDSLIASTLKRKLGTPAGWEMAHTDAVLARSPTSRKNEDDLGDGSTPSP